MLFYVLIIDSEILKDMLFLLVLSVLFLRLFVVLFLLFLYFMLGMFLMVFYSKFKELSGVMVFEIFVVLKNYFFIGNSLWKLEIIIFFGLYLVFLVVFVNGIDEKLILKLVWLVLVVFGFYVIVFGFKVLNKLFDLMLKGGVN